MGYAAAVQVPDVFPAAAAPGLSVNLVRRLDSDANTPLVGNPVGSLTELFDYRCPYCRIVKPTPEALVARDRRVRLVFKEWPIFGGSSVEAARVALASEWQGKYAQVHRALFNLPCTMDDAAIRKAATDAEVDMVVRLDRDMADRSSEIDASLAGVSAQARAIGFQGTSGFFIGNIVAPGLLNGPEPDYLVDQAASNKN